FDTKPEMVETEIPISYLLVVGDVPMYYYDNKGNPVGGDGKGAPNISLPMEPSKKSEGVSKTLPHSGGLQLNEGVSSLPSDHPPDAASEGGQEPSPEAAPASEGQSDAAVEG